MTDDYTRSQVRELLVDLVEHPSSDIDQSIERIDVASAFKKLPLKYKKVLLYRAKGFKRTEIARLVSETTTTTIVRRLLTKAEDALLKKLNCEENEHAD